MYAKGMTTRQISDSIEDMYGFDVFEGYIRAEGLIARRSSRGCWFPMSQTRYLCRLRNGRTGRLMMFIRSCTSMPSTISVGDNGVIVKKPLMGISKNSLFAIFSRLRRVVTRWIIASYNIAFSKLPLKTVVFRGSLMSFLDLLVTGARKCCRLP